MSEARSLLFPFGSTLPKVNLELSVFVERDGPQISLDYRLIGSVEEILFPKKKVHPERLDLLWEHTCLEAFISWNGNPLYWELNLSPAGDWNLYKFTQYRKDQTVENRIRSIQSSVIETGRTNYSIYATLDLAPILPENKEIELELGLTAVMEGKNLSKTYWALSHLGAQPDFHIRESFLFRI